MKWAREERVRPSRNSLASYSRHFETKKKRKRSHINFAQRRQRKIKVVLRRKRRVGFKRLPITLGSCSVSCMFGVKKADGIAGLGFGSPRKNGKSVVAALDSMFVDNEFGGFPGDN